MPVFQPEARSLVLAARWAARGLSALLLCFWGSFYFAHLGEWFVGKADLPPAFVLLSMGLMLVGLLAGWRWEVPGALLLLVASVTFFWRVGGPNFLLFAGLTNLPTALWLYSGLARRASPA